MDTLEKLFGSLARIKIMRLFLLNPEKIFSKDNIIKQARVASSFLSKELSMLEKINFIRKKSFFAEIKYAGGKLKKKRIYGYVLNSDFKYISPIQRMLVDSKPMEHKEIIKRISPAGKVKAIVVSGLFIQENESRVDLLVVGDYISEQKIKNTVLQMESEIGRQIRYTLLETQDYKYRLSICDKLVRDIFDYPHEVVFDKIGS